MDADRGTVVYRMHIEFGGLNSPPCELGF